MPKFIINTNISKDKVPDCLIEELNQQLPKALGKPAQTEDYEIEREFTASETCNLMPQENPFKSVDCQGMYLALQISTDQLMSFHGSSDPCAMCFLYSIGKIGDQENKGYSRLLCDLLDKHLKIPADRVYISYFDISAANVGWNYTTFA